MNYLILLKLKKETILTPEQNIYNFFLLNKKIMFRTEIFPFLATVVWERFQKVMKTALSMWH